MTRTTYIKPNSHAQQVASESRSIVARILKCYRITYEQWLHVLFDTGCRFVEGKHRNQAYRTELLTNEAHGFWAMWMNAFINDDAVMLASPDVFTGDYAFWKEQMANPYA